MVTSLRTPRPEMMRPHRMMPEMEMLSEMFARVAESWLPTPARLAASVAQAASSAVMRQAEHGAQQRRRGPGGEAVGEVEHPDHDHRGPHQRQQQRRLALHQSRQHKGHQHPVGADEPDQRAQPAPARHGDHDDGVEHGQEDDRQGPDKVDEDIGRGALARRRPGPWRGSGSGCCRRPSRRGIWRRRG